MQQQRDDAEANMSELEEEHGNDDGLLSEAMSDAGNVTMTKVNARLKQLDKTDPNDQEELTILQAYKAGDEVVKKAKKKQKLIEAELEQFVSKQYPKLSVEEIQDLVIQHKWLAEVEQAFRNEINGISHQLAQRVKELVERYSNPLPKIEAEVQHLEQQVYAHLQAMNYTL